MQAKLRRALAVLGVLAMLCTLLPLGAISVAAAAGEVIFSDGFESGTVGGTPSGYSAHEATYLSTITSNYAHSGSNSIALAARNNRSVLYRNLTVTPNTEYTVSVWYYFTNNSSSTGAVNYYLGVYVPKTQPYLVKDGGVLIDSAAGEATLDYHKSSWTQLTYTFNSGSATQVCISFACADSNKKFTSTDAFAYLDDLTVTQGETVEPEQPGEGGETTMETIVAMDWNDGTLGFNKGSIVAGGPDGSNCFKWSAGGGWSATYITVKNMDPAKAYTITLKAKASVAGKMGITIQNGDWGSFWNGPSFSVTTEWQDVTIEIAANQYPFTKGSILFKFQDTGSAMDLYVDDLVIAEKVTEPTPEPEEPENNNLVLNGSFENDTASWTVKNCTYEIVTGDAVDGNKALKISNITGQYAAAALSNTIATTPGNIYTIKWWSKRISDDKQAFNLYIVGNHTKISGQNWMTKAASAGWVEHEYVIQANSDCQSIQLKFSTEVSGGNSGTILIDNVSVVEKKQPSFDGYFYNGDFECGETTYWEIHQQTELSRDAAKNGKYGLNLKGDGTYGGMANQTFTTEVGKIYLVSLWAKTNQNGANITIKDASNTTLAHEWFTKTEWTKVEFEFSATSTSTLLNFSGGGNGNNGDVYIDDIRVVQLQDPSFDGYVYNGDFEAGSLTMWESFQDTVLSTNAAYSGNYGAHIYGNAQWGGLLNQTITVEPGKTYKISFWYRGWSNGVNFNIKNGDDKLVSKYFSFKYSTGWEYFEATFEAGYATRLQITFSGSGLATTTAGVGTHDECYVDDLKVENLSGDEIDRNSLTTQGGISIRDMTDGNRGLAFRFTLNANGIQVQNGNEYVPGTGTLNLYKYDSAIGNLIGFGAVVTNNAAIGSDFTLDNVDNSKTIDIPAVYLLDLEDDAIQYAVRIVNIPDNGAATTVYARPYYTYELNGETYTIYGAIQSDSYDHVASVRRSLKILAIGNSFSVDAMENHLYDLLKSADYDQVILGNLYIGGCSLDTHWSNISTGQAAYEFRKNDDNGTWVKTQNYNALTALQEENWDIITIQQASPDSGNPDTYTNLQNIVNWINENKTKDSARVLWHMTWAYQQNSDHSGFAYYGNNQMTMYNAIVNTAENTAMKVNGIDGIIPSGTAIQNLRTSNLGDTLTADGYHLKDTYGDYTAALTWFRAITGESLDLVTYWPESVKNYQADIMQAAARAVYAPYEVSDLSETVIVALSDFQASTDEKGANQVAQILNGGIAQKYGMFDGLFAVGDYSAQMGYDVALTGIQALDQVIDPYVSGNKIYTEGNHDAPDLPGLSPSGNNDPNGGKYGVFVINEEDYDQFGEGGEATAAAMQAYFDEKLADNSWGNKPIFVLCHVPLHYSMRTETSNNAKTARPMVDVLNDAGAAGLNIIFLFGHNHSGGYDDFLGAGSVYLKKGDSMIVPQYGANYKYNWDTVTLNFTYMNVGYVGYNADNGYGADVALTVTTYRILSTGEVIITRWDKYGEHNLKSMGVSNTVLQDTFDPDLTVYESSRVVTATDDRKYEGD